MTFSFIVPGEPVAWKRVGRDPKFGHSYIHKSVRQAMKDVANSYRAAGGKMLEGPIRLHCAFYLGGRCRSVELDPRDLSNMIKLVEDALEGHAYKNDRRIVAYSPIPFKAMDKANPRTVILVDNYQDDDAVHQQAHLDFRRNVLGES